MRYLFLIYDSEVAGGAMTPDKAAGRLTEWFEYTENLQKTGKMLGGEALRPTSTATTLRRSGQRPLISDGPFAETKEQLGGYYLVEAANLDEAIALASGMPHLESGGSTEIRPLMEFET